MKSRHARDAGFNSRASGMSSRASGALLQHSRPLVVHTTDLVIDTTEIDMPHSQRLAMKTQQLPHIRRGPATSRMSGVSRTAPPAMGPATTRAGPVGPKAKPQRAGVKEQGSWRFFDTEYVMPARPELREESDVPTLPPIAPAPPAMPRRDAHAPNITFSQLAGLASKQHGRSAVPEEQYMPPMKAVPQHILDGMMNPPQSQTAVPGTTPQVKLAPVTTASKESRGRSQSMLVRDEEVARVLETMSMSASRAVLPTPDTSHSTSRSPPVADGAAKAQTKASGKPRKQRAYPPEAKGYAQRRHNPPLTEANLARIDAGELPDGANEHARAEDAEAERSGWAILRGVVHVHGAAAIARAIESPQKKARSTPQAGQSKDLRSRIRALGTKHEAADSSKTHAQLLQEAGERCINIMCSFAPVVAEEPGYAEESLEVRVNLRRQYIAMHPLEGVKLASDIPTELRRSIMTVGKNTSAGETVVAVQHEQPFGTLALAPPRKLDYLLISGGNGGQLFDDALPSDRDDRLAFLRERQREAEAHFGLAR